MKKLSEIKYSDYKRIKDRINRFLAVVLYTTIISQALYWIPYSKNVDFLRNHYITRHQLIIGIIATFFAFYSLVRLVQSYNEPLKNEYLDSPLPKETAIDKLKILFGIKRLKIAVLVFAAIYILFSTKLLNYGIYVFILGAETRFLPQLALRVGLLGFLLILAIWAHLTAVKSWEKEGKLSETEIKKENKDYRRMIIVTPIAYVIGGIGIGLLYTPIVIFLNMLLNLYYLLAVAAVIIIPIIFKYIRALRIRRKFIKQLIKHVKNKRCRISKIKHPYKTAFSIYKGESFTLSIHGKMYSCKLIGAPKKNMPFVLLPNGMGTFVKIFRFFKIEVYSYNKNFRYDYESPYPKILIVNPISKFLYTAEGAVGDRDGDGRDMHIYTTGSTRNNGNLKRIRMLNGEEAEFTVNGGKTARLDNGDRVGEYKIFSATGFLNAVDRDCLDR